MPHVVAPAAGGVETQHAARTPEGNVQHAAAHRAVLLHTLADVFRLQPEEAIWVGYELDSVLAPLVVHTPTDIPFPVRQELLHSVYSRGLDALLADQGKTVCGDSAATLATHGVPRRSVSVNDWVTVLLSPIFTSYPLDPLTQARMRHELSRILDRIGVEGAHNVRYPAYLPVAVRALFH